MNDLFKITFHFLQVIPKSDSLINLQGMDVIFSVLYASIFKGYVWFPQCYMHHSSRDIYDLSNAICINLQGMDVVFLMLYASIFKG